MSMYSRHYNDFKEKIAPPLPPHSVATLYFVKYLMGGAKLTRFGHLAFAIWTVIGQQPSWCRKVKILSKTWPISINFERKVVLLINLSGAENDEETRLRRNEIGALWIIVFLPKWDGYLARIWPPLNLIIYKWILRCKIAKAFAPLSRKTGIWSLSEIYVLLICFRLLLGLIYRIKQIFSALEILWGLFWKPTRHDLAFAKGRLHTPPEVWKVKQRLEFLMILLHNSAKLKMKFMLLAQVTSGTHQTS